MSDYRNYIKILKSAKRISSTSSTKTSRKNSIAAELIRNTHSIEKGLSISNPRLGFGHQKLEKMMDEIALLNDSTEYYHKEACKMGLGALKEYIHYHGERDYSDTMCEKIKKYIQTFPNDYEKYGGTIQIDNSEMCFNIPEIEHFFRSRHSIRDFSDEHIKNEDLMKALTLAQSAPSACNRQGVRAYVLSYEKSKSFSRELSGIGGFAEAVDRYILITGLTSAYRSNEQNQYIVSASIFAAYLSLTLHLYGIGSCIIQRSVIWDETWEKNREWLGIAEDEQLICLFATGILKDHMNVPKSHRLNPKSVFRFIE